MEGCHKYKPEDTSNTPLTKAEHATILLVELGKTNAEIAKELFVCEQTIKHRIWAICSKLGASSRYHAVYLAIVKKEIPCPCSIIANDELRCGSFF